jgi:hypothetical protein
MSFLSDLGKVAGTIGKSIVSVAPAAAKVLTGGGTGAAVEIAYRAVKDRLVPDIPDVTPEDVARYVSNLSEDDLKKKLDGVDNEVLVKLKELEIKHDQIFLEDQQHARTIKDPQREDNIDFLTYFYTGGLALMIVSFMVMSALKIDMPEFHKGILQTILGFLIAKNGDLVSFFFGTSRSSQEHMRTISDKLKRE